MKRFLYLIPTLLVFYTAIYAAAQTVTFPRGVQVEKSGDTLTFSDPVVPSRPSLAADLGTGGVTGQVDFDNLASDLRDAIEGSVQVDGISKSDNDLNFYSDGGTTSSINLGIESFATEGDSTRLPRAKLPADLREVSTGGTTSQVLTKHATGYGWDNVPGATGGSESGTTIVNKLEGLSGSGRLNYNAIQGGPPTNAEQNVQVDWHETDITSDAYIQHKPVIPAPTTGADYRDGLEGLSGNDRLQVSAIRGIDGEVATLVRPYAQAGTTVKIVKTDLDTALYDELTDAEEVAATIKEFDTDVGTTRNLSVYNVNNILDTGIDMPASLPDDAKIVWQMTESGVTKVSFTYTVGQFRALPSKVPNGLDNGLGRLLIDESPKVYIVRCNVRRICVIAHDDDWQDRDDIDVITIKSRERGIDIRDVVDDPTIPRLTPSTRSAGQVLVVGQDGQSLQFEDEHTGSTGVDVYHNGNRLGTGIDTLSFGAGINATVRGPEVDISASSTPLRAKQDGVSLGNVNIETINVEDGLSASIIGNELSIVSEGASDADVSARITERVAPPALAGNTDPWPEDKLPVQDIINLTIDAADDRYINLQSQTYPTQTRVTDAYINQAHLMAQQHNRGFAPVQINFPAYTQRAQAPLRDGSIPPGKIGKSSVRGPVPFVGYISYNPVDHYDNAKDVFQFHLDRNYRAKNTITHLGVRTSPTGSELKLTVSYAQQGNVYTTAVVGNSNAGYRVPLAGKTLYLQLYSNDAQLLFTDSGIQEGYIPFSALSREMLNHEIWGANAAQMTYFRAQDNRWLDPTTGQSGGITDAQLYADAEMRIKITIAGQTFRPNTLWSTWFSVGELKAIKFTGDPSPVPYKEVYFNNDASYNINRQNNCVRFNIPGVLNLWIGIRNNYLSFRSDHSTYFTAGSSIEVFVRNNYGS